jgi:polyribonucleotide nucleotidyltransferase
MMIGASMDSIAMVEGEMKEISEAEMLEAIKFAHEHIKIKLCSIAFASCFWKKRSSYYEGEREDEAIYAKVKAASYDKIYAIAKAKVHKQERTAAFEEVKEEVKAIY